MGKSKLKAVLTLLLLAVTNWRVEAFVSRPVSASVTSRLPGGTSSSPFPPKHPSSLNPLKLSDDASKEDGKPKVYVDPLVKEASLLLKRLSWASWWAQLILTTVSSVTLVFARNVITQSSNSIAEAKSLPNFLLAGAGIIFSFVSILWTWATRRLSRRLLKKSTFRVQAANMLRKSVDVGVTINIIGMLFTILGAEQIVGGLAIKVLTTSRTVTLLESSSLLQPLDILVVQANTNTLFSHFCSMVALLYVSKSVLKLDPPSVKGDERER